MSISSSPTSASAVARPGDILDRRSRKRNGRQAKGQQEGRWWEARARLHRWRISRRPRLSSCSSYRTIEARPGFNRGSGVTFPQTLSPDALKQQGTARTVASSLWHPEVTRPGSDHPAAAARRKSVFLEARFADHHHSDLISNRASHMARVRRRAPAICRARVPRLPPMRMSIPVFICV